MFFRTNYFRVVETKNYFCTGSDKKYKGLKLLKKKRKNDLKKKANKNNFPSNYFYEDLHLNELRLVKRGHNTSTKGMDSGQAGQSAQANLG